MVGVLRRAEAAELAPTLASSDCGRLAQSRRRSRVDVRLEGDVDSVPPTVAAAVFRLGQEAVTNARRHARNATRIDVVVRVDDGGVRVEVRDDGQAAASALPGYGIHGMRERAVLLGGHCEAGPRPDGGWLVTATLPRGWTP